MNKAKKPRKKRARRSRAKLSPTFKPTCAALCRTSQSFKRTTLLLLRQPNRKSTSFVDAHPRHQIFHHPDTSRNREVSGWYLPTPREDPRREFFERCLIVNAHPDATPFMGRHESRTFQA